MQCLTRAFFFVTLFAFTSCKGVRLPMMGEPVSPIQMMAGQGNEDHDLPLLQEVEHGLGSNPAIHPVVDPGEIICYWVVPHTESDILWVGGHNMCFNYVPSRFKPQPDGISTIPVAPEVQTVKEDKKDKEESRTAQKREVRQPAVQKPTKVVAPTSDIGGVNSTTKKTFDMFNDQVELFKKKAQEMAN